MTATIERPEARSELIGLRLRPDEAERVRELASAWACTPTEVVRRAVLREINVSQTALDV